MLLNENYDMYFSGREIHILDKDGDRVFSIYINDSVSLWSSQNSPYPELDEEFHGIADAISFINDTIEDGIAKQEDVD